MFKTVFNKGNLLHKEHCFVQLVRPESSFQCNYLKQTVFSPVNAGKKTRPLLHDYDFVTS